MAVQWVHLGAEVLIAADRGACLQQTALGTPAFWAPMPEDLPSTLASTRHLLDGAIAAAERAAPPRGQPPMTALRWARHLVNQWHSAHRSPDLLAESIERFNRCGREDLATFARTNLDEETGHDQYPLDDLRALGYDADALVQAIGPDPAVAAALDYARDAVRGENPIEFLGYVYALERGVVRIPQGWFAELARLLPAGVDGASGLRCHATELDHAHVEEAVEFVSRLPATDRASVARGAHHTTQIRCAYWPETGLHEEEFAARLARFVLATHEGGVI